MADTIVRDQKDYPDATTARASLPEMYIEYPYVGVWVQQGDPPECPMYVFSTQPAEYFAGQGWTLNEAGQQE